jgi:hypothetical protein
MRLYGSGALSSSTLWNPEFTHMFVPGVGSQAYFIGQAYNRTIVVGINDPLAHPDYWAEMAATFSRVFPGATYTHVGPRFAQVLKDTQGYTINDAGAETNIQVQKFNYSKRTRTIRNGARDARAAGVSVRELRAADLTPETCQQLKAVTGAWVIGGCGAFPVAGRTTGVLASWLRTRGSVCLGALCWLWGGRRLQDRQQQQVWGPPANQTPGYRIWV